MVNIVGNHALSHLELDAPLTSDIEGLAHPMSQWVKSCPSAQEVANVTGEAIAAAKGQPAKIATLILPADAAWSEIDEHKLAQSTQQHMPSAGSSVSPEMASAYKAVKKGETTLLLLGKTALTAKVSEWAGKIAAVTGCHVKSEFYGPRIERGAGRVALPRLPYAVDPSLKVLENYDTIVLVGASEPVAFFAYPDKPGRLSKPGCEFVKLTAPGDDAEYILKNLARDLGAEHVAPAGMVESQTLVCPEGALSTDGIGQVIACHIPENAIVVDEALTTGRQFDSLTQQAKPHDWLTGMGGSIGYALPVALGAAIAAPDRRVIALEGDGSAMYTLQALWSMARENLNVTVVIFANRQYKILNGEFASVGAGTPGQSATDMLTLDRPNLDWPALSKGLGLPCRSVQSLGELSDALRRSLAEDGPTLIEVVM